MARTETARARANRAAAATVGRGTTYSSSRGGRQSQQGRGRGRGRGGRPPSVSLPPAGPPKCETNKHVCERLRSYAAHRLSAVTDNFEDRIYWMAAKELWNHDQPVTNAREAIAVKKIGKFLAGRIETYLVWHTATQKSAPTSKGRWEAYADMRWWRLEYVNMETRVHVRRSWGILGQDGFEETISTLVSMQAAETLMAKCIRDKLREGYEQASEDIGDCGGNVEGEESQETVVVASPKKQRSREETLKDSRVALRENLAELYDESDVEAVRREERQRLVESARQRQEIVRNREYKPKLLNQAGCVSGVAAILIALLRGERKHGFVGYKKQEIVENAQPLCPETPMLPTNQKGPFVDSRAHYGAIRSLNSTLIKNGVVEHAGTKKHFRLTREPGVGRVSGHVLAQRLESELIEHQGGSPSKNDDVYVRERAAELPAITEPWLSRNEKLSSTSRQPDIIVLEDSDDEEEDSDGEEDCLEIIGGPPAREMKSAPPVKRPRHLIEEPQQIYGGAPSTGSLFNDDYDITLAVDSREKIRTNRNEVEAMIVMLRDQHNLLRVTKKTLNVADYMWIATPRGQSLDDWKRGCLVMGRCIERKVVEDFKGTVRDGTHHSKQRLRMLRSPLKRLIYIVEGSIEELQHANDRQLILDEMSRLELVDGFTVHCSETFNTTAAYLKALDDIVRQMVRGKTTAEVMAMPDVVPYDSIADSIDVDPTKWKLKRRWGIMLLHVPGLKQNHAESIADAYDTPAKLVQALIAHGAETSAAKPEPLLTRVLEPGKKRAKLAGDVARFFLDKEYDANHAADDSLLASFEKGIY